MNSTPHPKRILMTADTVGGVWIYALELACALGAYGVQVVLATMGAPVSRAQVLEASAIANLEIVESRFKLEWMKDPWLDVEAAGEWLLDLEARYQPDIVHLNNYAHGALPWRAPVLLVGHSCVLSWWEAVKGQPVPGEWTRYRAAVTQGLQAADLVVAPSQTMLAWLERFYGPLPPTLMISNGRNGQFFQPAHKQPLIFSAGRLWDEAKNVRTLSAIAARLDWPVCVAGHLQGPDGREVAVPGMRFLGQLAAADIAAWYSLASIYAFPARYEPFGISVLEAALCGCALVLGDIPTLRENWTGAALFVPPNDPEALAAALRELIADPGTRAELGARARVRALAFPHELMAARYQVAYTELLERQQSRQPRDVALCES